MGKTVKLTINGKGIITTEGKSVLQAGLDAGIYIPNLCADSSLLPYGGCRMCIAEIEGMRGLPTTCTVMAQEGMKVNTESEAVQKARKDTCELILSNHPLDCLSCPKNGSCELQKVAAYVGITERTLPQISKKVPVDASNPFFSIDRNYCILCAKCVRTCDEITGINAIEIVNRGFESRISTFADKPLMESNCRSCGECMARCPVAAIKPKEYTPFTESVKSICPYCGVGCGIELNIKNGVIVSVSADKENPSNNGRLCVKGRFGIKDFVHHKDRLKTPLIRKNGKFTEASWNEALKLIASKLKEYEGSELGVFSSAKCTNEENYIIQKFARSVLKTNNIDHCARLCHAPSVSGLAQSFGSGAMTNSMEDVKEAKSILAIGSNTTETHPVIGFNVKNAVKNGAKLIVANPLRIPLVDYAALWIRHNPGTDVALLMGMMKIIVDNNLHNAVFIRERTENFQEFKEALKNFPLDKISQITGVPATDIEKAAKIYAENSPAAILYAMGITQHSHGTDNVIATANLAMLCGNIGIRGGGVNPLRGQNNVQGACDMGGLPNVYTGYQKVEDEASRKKFEEAYSCALPAKNGLTVTEMISQAGKSINAMYIVGENPILSDPDSNHVRESLKKLGFLVVQDIFLTETAKLADVVLPGATFAEKDGTFTNTERRVQRVRKAFSPLGKAKADWQITCEIARKMGAEGFSFRSPKQIFNEIASLTPSYSGMSYGRLEKGGLQWPCPSAESQGTPIMHRDKFTRGKGKFIPLEYKPPAEETDSEYPFILTTGRSLFHFHTGTMTRKVKGLNAFKGEESVVMSYKDACSLNINSGDLLEITSRRGKVKAKAEISKISPKGVVFMTFHFVESPTNEVTSPALDPLAKIPELKVAAVHIKKIS